MTNTIVNFGLRGAQALFAIITLGLASTLIKNQVKDRPSILGYAAFVGGISIAGALVGLASTWVEILQGIIGAGVDAVIIFANIAGGIIIAYKIRGISCTSQSDENLKKIAKDNLISGGCVGEETFCEGYTLDTFNARCKESQADAAFMFLTAIVVTAAITLTLLHLRRNK